VPVFKELVLDLYNKEREEVIGLEDFVLRNPLNDFGKIIHNFESVSDLNLNDGKTIYLHKL